MLATAFNSTDGPVVVDAAGRTIGGGEYGTVETTEEAYRDAMEAGKLVLMPELGPDTTDEAVEEFAPGAREAHARTVQVAKAVALYGDTDKRVLAKAAELSSVQVSADPHKDELVRELAYADIEPTDALSKAAEALDDEQAAADTESAETIQAARDDEVAKARESTTATDEALAAMTVDDLKAYLAENPGEAERVLETEQAKKPAERRKTVYELVESIREEA